MRTQSNPAIRVAAAALALSACGFAVGIGGGMPVAHASVVAARPAPGNTGFADLRDLAQLKRNLAWKAMQHARAQASTGTAPFADLRDLAQLKRDVARNAMEHARAQASTGTAPFADLSDLAQLKRAAIWKAVGRAPGR